MLEMQCQHSTDVQICFLWEINERSHWIVNPWRSSSFPASTFQGWTKGGDWKGAPWGGTVKHGLESREISAGGSSLRYHLTSAWAPSSSSLFILPRQGIHRDHQVTGKEGDKVVSWLGNHPCSFIRQSTGFYLPSIQGALLSPSRSITNSGLIHASTYTQDNKRWTS